MTEFENLEQVKLIETERERYAGKSLEKEHLNLSKPQSKKNEVRLLIVVYISLSFNKFVAISLKKYYLTMKQIEISCKNSVQASRNRDEVQIYFNGRYFD